MVEASRFFPVALSSLELSGDCNLAILSRHITSIGSADFRRLQLVRAIGDVAADTLSDVNETELDEQVVRQSGELRLVLYTPTVSLFPKRPKGSAMRPYLSAAGQMAAKRGQG